MFQVSRPQDASGEPSPDFATQQEIELAERLRRQLEQRYLAPSAPKPSVKSTSEDG